MFDVVKEISFKVSNLFPDFYKEQGRDFIDFVKTYYEFLETEKNITDTSRQIQNFRDIDETLDEYVEFFRKKYMINLPEKILRDKRFLQKHILDLYRSKGSFEGVELLFRFLYNESVDIYIPSYDIFKPDNSEWFDREYFELTNSPILFEYSERNITGYSSGAKAVANQLEEITIFNKKVKVLFLSEVFGTFEVGERLIFENFFDQYTIDQAPIILGSPSSVNFVNYASGFLIGDEIVQKNSEEDEGKYLRLRVLNNFSGSGFIEFNLQDGGSGYTEDAQIFITNTFTFPTDYENWFLEGGVFNTNGIWIDNASFVGTTSGIGANFEITSITDGEIQYFNDTPIQPYANVLIGAESYSIANNDISDMEYANANTIITYALNFNTITVGKIESIRTTNPGAGYVNPVNVKIIDPYTSLTNEYDPNLDGQNAVVTSNVVSGNTLISSDNVKIIESGIGFNNENQVIEGEGADPIINYLFLWGDLEGINLINQRNNYFVTWGDITFQPISLWGDQLERIIDPQFTVNLSAIGKRQGYWRDQNSFLDDRKYLQDDFFYQEYSYELKSSKSLNRYIQILKDLMHTTGNEIFGQATILHDDPSPFDHISLNFNEDPLYIKCLTTANTANLAYESFGTNSEKIIAGNIIVTSPYQMYTIAPESWNSKIHTFDMTKYHFSLNSKRLLCEI